MSSSLKKVWTLTFSDICVTVKKFGKWKTYISKRHSRHRPKLRCLFKNSLNGIYAFPLLNAVVGVD